MTFLAITDKSDVTTFCFQADVSKLGEIAGIHVIKQGETPLLDITVPSIQGIVPQNVRTSILFQFLHSYFDDFDKFLEYCPKSGEFRVRLYWLPDSDELIIAKMRGWTGLP